MNCSSPKCHYIFFHTSSINIKTANAALCSLLLRSLCWAHSRVLFLHHKRSFQWKNQNHSSFRLNSLVGWQTDANMNRCGKNSLVQSKCIPPGLTISAPSMLGITLHFVYSESRPGQLVMCINIKIVLFWSVVIANYFLCLFVCDGHFVALRGLSSTFDRHLGWWPVSSHESWFMNMVLVSWKKPIA